MGGSGHEAHRGTRRADAPSFSPTRSSRTARATAPGARTAERYQVVVHVDEAILPAEPAARDDEPHRCELEAGPALAVDSARRLCCDGTIVKLVETPAASRSISAARPAPFRRAAPRAPARRRRLPLPGCDRTRFTEGHHVRHWADGGETKLATWSRCAGSTHGLVHEGGFGLTATDDGLCSCSRGRTALEFRNPRGAAKFRGTSRLTTPSRDCGNRRSRTGRSSR